MIDRSPFDAVQESCRWQVALGSRGSTSMLRMRFQARNEKDVDDVGWEPVFKSECIWSEAFCFASFSVCFFCEHVGWAFCQTVAWSHFSCSAIEAPTAVEESVGFLASCSSFRRGVLELAVYPKTSFNSKVLWQPKTEIDVQCQPRWVHLFFVPICQTVGSSSLSTETQNWSPQTGVRCVDGRDQSEVLPTISADCSWEDVGHRKIRGCKEVKAPQVQSSSAVQRMMFSKIPSCRWQSVCVRCPVYSEGLGDKHQKRVFGIFWRG